MDCKSFNEFRAARGDEFTDNLLQRICEGLWSKDDPTVKIDDTYKINVSNDIYYGYVIEGEEEFQFVIEMGDCVGTEVREWGLLGDVHWQPPKPTMLTFEPVLGKKLKELNPAKYKVWLQMKKSDEFKQKVSNMNYDSVFGPPSTMSYYRGWAAARDLQIVREDVK